MKLITKDNPIFEWTMRIRSCTRPFYMDDSTKNNQLLMNMSYRLARKLNFTKVEK